MGLTMREKTSVAKETALRYGKAKKREKENMLDEFVMLTGYNRKYAIRKLNGCIKVHEHVFNGKRIESVKVQFPHKTRRIYARKYDADVVKSVLAIRAFYDHKSGQFLCSFIRDNIDALMKHSELFFITDEVKEKLLAISPATINRIIAQDKRLNKAHGISTTKPNKGFSLNALIPIRTFYDWDERKPGFFEMDTVSHDGGNASGEYIFTLSMTDVCTGWTEIRPLLNKAHQWVVGNVEGIKNSLAYEMKGVDSDNGGEFKNNQLYNWCVNNKIQFTRSRSYHKNDNCFVEEKNYSVVRKLVGYYRYEGQETLGVMRELYENYCTLVNYFYPSVFFIIGVAVFC